MIRWMERCAALAAVLLIPFLVALLSLPAVLVVCDRWPRVRGRQAAPGVLADRVRRWLAHGRGPWTSSCLTRSLVLYALLRQHGYRPRLHVGVEGAARAFAAHAWVTLDDHPIEQPATVGDRYTPLMVHGG